jgi:hypothetical protein
MDRCGTFAADAPQVRKAPSVATLLFNPNAMPYARLIEPRTQPDSSAFLPAVGFSKPRALHPFASLLTASREMVSISSFEARFQPC